MNKSYDELIGTLITTLLYIEDYVGENESSMLEEVRDIQSRVYSFDNRMTYEDHFETN